MAIITSLSLSVSFLLSSHSLVLLQVNIAYASDQVTGQDNQTDSENRLCFIVEELFSLTSLVGFSKQPPELNPGLPLLLFSVC
jgi:hypothetical protein